MKFNLLAHDVGRVRLEVALNGIVISAAVSFEYKDQSGSNTGLAGPAPDFDEDLLPLDSIMIQEDDETAMLKRTLLKKVEVIKKDLAESSSSTSSTEVAVIEEVLVALIERLMNHRQWKNNASFFSTSLLHSSPPTDMTLLHLAAALGYTK